MQKLTVNIPDNKLSFFTELVHSLGFKVDKDAPKEILTAKQIELVNKERRKINGDPGHFLDWEEARKTLNTD